ncbi:MAG: DUF5131 family protein [Halobacteriota archaeon]|nr:DUF5131 family protein [Halobacteriota archaeon]
MGKNSKIGWTDHTFNPVVGCEPISPACQNCYAKELVERRFKNNFSTRRRTKDWFGPMKWQAESVVSGKSARVFCGSLCDVFDEAWDPIWRDELFHLIMSTPFLHWLVLTKRTWMIPRDLSPMPQIWIGATVEDDWWARRRGADMHEVKSKIKFASIEPMLGEISLENLRWASWLIIGEEKLPGNRPGRNAPIKSAERLCRDFDGPVFMKQMCIDGKIETDIDKFPEWAKRREIPDV